MAQDIFGRRQLEYGGTFAADAASINFSFTGAAGNGAGNQVSWLGLLVQQLSVSYQQMLTRAYEIGSQKVYFIVGRPRGNFQMQRLIGPSPLVAAFYYKFGNACCAASNVLNIDAQPNCNPDISSTNARVRYQFDGVVLTALQISVQAEGMVISEALSGEYVSASLPNSTNTISCS